MTTAAEGAIDEVGDFVRGAAAPWRDEPCKRSTSAPCTPWSTNAAAVCTSGTSQLARPDAFGDQVGESRAHARERVFLTEAGFVEQQVVQLVMARRRSRTVRRSSAGCVRRPTYPEMTAAPPRTARGSASGGRRADRPSTRSTGTSFPWPRRRPRRRRPRLRTRSPRSSSTCCAASSSCSRRTSGGWRRDAALSAMCHTIGHCRLTVGHVRSWNRLTVGQFRSRRRPAMTDAKSDLVIPNHHAGHRRLRRRIRRGRRPQHAVGTGGRRPRWPPISLRSPTRTTSSTSVAARAPPSERRRRRGARVTGVDPAPVMLKLARAVTRNAAIVSPGRAVSPKHSPCPTRRPACTGRSRPCITGTTSSKVSLEARRVLEPEGRLLVIERLRRPTARQGTRGTGGRSIRPRRSLDCARQAGFESADDRDVRAWPRSGGRRASDPLAR